MTEKEKTTALLSSFQVSAEHNLDNNHIFLTAFYNQFIHCQYLLIYLLI